MKADSNHFNLEKARDLGGKEIVTYIQFGYFLEIQIDIFG